MNNSNNNVRPVLLYIFSALLLTQNMNVKHWCWPLNLGIKFGYVWTMPENVTKCCWKYH